MSELELCGTVHFPAPEGVMVNMMPIVPGDPSTNPHPQYQPMIDQCGVNRSGEVWYLTINECEVPKGDSQRRGGVHVEAPGSEGLHGGGSGGTGWGGGWGGGSSKGGRRDGIYMASNVHASCRAWNVRVEDRDPHGGCEEPDAPETLLGRNELWWMTDRCPHEALPAESSYYRQFFRLISPDVSLWYARHNSENPLGVKPGCEVVGYSKFEEVE